MFRFAIRDVLWLTIVAAMAVAWLADHRRLLNEVLKESRVEAIAALEDYGAAVLYDDQFGQTVKPRVAAQDRPVYLVGFNPGEFEPKAIPHLKALPELKCLVIQEPQLDNSVLDDVSVLIQLQELELQSCGITDEGTAKLAALAKLQKLGLGGNPFGDAGIQGFASLNCLKELNLSRTNVTCGGVAKLLSNSPSIRKVVVEKCEKVDKRELAKLREKYLTVEIFD